MEVQSDFKDLLELFNVHNVKYMIVGGYALAFHGAPRYTGDIDILVKPDAENARNILNALDEFGFAFSGLAIQDFENPDNVIQLGVPPVRIDIITSLSGVSWEEAFANHENGEYGSVSVKFIGRKQFILNKLATGRKKDFADLEALNEE
jgi:hypothetical protein